jgi:hypothetical protein
LKGSKMKIGFIGLGNGGGKYWGGNRLMLAVGS